MGTPGAAGGLSVASVDGGATTLSAGDLSLSRGVGVTVNPGMVPGGSSAPLTPNPDASFGDEAVGGGVVGGASAAVAPRQAPRSSPPSPSSPLPPKKGKKNRPKQSSPIPPLLTRSRSLPAAAASFPPASVF